MPLPIELATRLENFSEFVSILCERHQEGLQRYENIDQYQLLVEMPHILNMLNRIPLLDAIDEPTNKLLERIKKSLNFLQQRLLNSITSVIGSLLSFKNDDPDLILWLTSVRIAWLSKLNNIAEEYSDKAVILVEDFENQNKIHEISLGDGVQKFIEIFPTLTNNAIQQVRDAITRSQGNAAVKLSAQRALQLAIAEQDSEISLFFRLLSGILYNLKTRPAMIAPKKDPGKNKKNEKEEKEYAEFRKEQEALNKTLAGYDQRQEILDIRCLMARYVLNTLNLTPVVPYQPHYTESQRQVLYADIKEIIKKWNASLPDLIAALRNYRLHSDSLREHATPALIEAFAQEFHNIRTIANYRLLVILNLRMETVLRLKMNDLWSYDIKEAVSDFIPHDQAAMLASLNNIITNQNGTRLLNLLCDICQLTSVDNSLTRVSTDLAIALLQPTPALSSTQPTGHHNTGALPLPVLPVADSAPKDAEAADLEVLKLERTDSPDSKGKIANLKQRILRMVDLANKHGQSISKEEIEARFLSLEVLSDAGQISALQAIQEGVGEMALNQMRDTAEAYAQLQSSNNGISVEGAAIIAAALDASSHSDQKSHAAASVSHVSSKQNPEAYINQYVGCLSEGQQLEFALLSTSPDSTEKSQGLVRLAQVIEGLIRGKDHSLSRADAKSVEVALRQFLRESSSASRDVTSSSRSDAVEDIIAVVLGEIREKLKRFRGSNFASYQDRLASILVLPTQNDQLKQLRALSNELDIQHPPTPDLQETDPNVEQGELINDINTKLEQNHQLLKKHDLLTGYEAELSQLIYQPDDTNLLSELRRFNISLNDKIKALKLAETCELSVPAVTTSQAVPTPSAPPLEKSDLIRMINAKFTEHPELLASYKISYAGLVSDEMSDLHSLIELNDMLAEQIARHQEELRMQEISRLVASAQQTGIAGSTSKPWVIVVPPSSHTRSPDGEAKAGPKK